MAVVMRLSVFQWDNSIPIFKSYLFLASPFLCLNLISEKYCFIKFIKSKLTLESGILFFGPFHIVSQLFCKRYNFIDIIWNYFYLPMENCQAFYVIFNSNKIWNHKTWKPLDAPPLSVAVQSFDYGVIKRSLKRCVWVRAIKPDFSNGMMWKQRSKLGH